MRTGESCLLGSRFNFGLLKIGASRHKSKLRGAGAIVSGDGKRPEQYFGKSNVCMAVGKNGGDGQGGIMTEAKPMSMTKATGREAAGVATLFVSTRGPAPPGR